MPGSDSEQKNSTNNLHRYFTEGKKKTMQEIEKELNLIVNLYNNGLLTIPETLQAMNSAIQSYTAGTDPCARATVETALYRKTLYNLHKAIVAMEKHN